MSNLLKNKKGTVIQRTTTETLRLGEDIVSHQPNRISTAPAPPRKISQVTSPNCSFQITGVSVTKYDLGDDSADDLDESHTDDISRITDNETPSFSEDSRDTDEPQKIIYNPAPITTSFSQNLPVLRVVKEGDNKKLEKRKAEIGRFKVIKIQNAVPITKGRWTCFDYTDQPEPMKISSMFRDKPSNAQPGTIQGIPKSVFRGDVSNRNTNVVSETKINTSALRGTNCQESVLSGSIVTPSGATTLFPLTNDRPPRPKVKYQSSTSVEAIPSKYSLQRPLRTPQTIQPMCGPVGYVANTGPPIMATGMNNVVRTTTQVPSQELRVADPNRNSTASVSCTASIDTKIEHALDVVKNHLTHAVRMEVEELKIRINELVDRINYLEYENDVLRANVAPEVLATLDNAVQK